jgi:hypothetical protein
MLMPSGSIHGIDNPYVDSGIKLFKLQAGIHTAASSKADT